MITIIGLYLLSRVYPLYGASGLETYIVEHDKIELVLSAKAYIARDEKVYRTLGEGEVKYFVDSGQRVAKGQKLAEVYLESFDEKTIEELEIINLRLENINNSTLNEEEIFEKDIEKINQEINQYLQQIQRDINLGDYSNINSYKNQLEVLAEKKNLISGDNSFGGKNANELLERKKQLEDRLRSNYQVVYSDIPGFVTFGSDGLEDIINLRSIESITSKDFDLLLNSEKQIKDKESEEKIPTIRIVQNHKWSIFLKLSPQDAEGFEAGNQYYIRNHTNDRKYQSILRSITTQEEDAILIFDLNESMEGALDVRSIEVDIIKTSFEGAIVPNTAIVVNQGTPGVFRIDVNGFARFVPIKVKGQNAGFSILYDGYFEEANDETDKVDRINTIYLYDEILMKGEGVLDGQKVK